MRVKVKKAPKHIKETKEVWNFYNSIRLVTINHDTDMKIDTPFKFYFHEVLIPPIEKDAITACSHIMDFNKLKESLEKFREANSVTLFYGWHELNNDCVNAVIEVCESYNSSKYCTLYDFKTIFCFLYQYMYYYINNSCNPIMCLHDDPIQK